MGPNEQLVIPRHFTSLSHTCQVSSISWSPAPFPPTEAHEISYTSYFLKSFRWDSQISFFRSCQCKNIKNSVSLSGGLWILSHYTERGIGYSIKVAQPEMFTSTCILFFVSSCCFWRYTTNVSFSFSSTLAWNIYIEYKTMIQQDTTIITWQKLL